tara:strand:+ start:152 stop:319 length:168 start_codon:yes stop_codon:yes gene_type:complete
MSTYLGSKILRGTVVLGKIIKLSKGKTGIVDGKSVIFIFIYYIRILKNKLKFMIF